MIKKGDLYISIFKDSERFDDEVGDIFKLLGRDNHDNSIHFDNISNPNCGKCWFYDFVAIDGNDKTIAKLVPISPALKILFGVE